MRKVGAITTALAVGGVLSVGQAVLAAPTSITVPNNSFENSAIDPQFDIGFSSPPWVLNGTGTIVQGPFGPVPAGAAVFGNPTWDGTSAQPDTAYPGRNLFLYDNYHLDGSDGTHTGDGAVAAYLFSNPGNSISQVLTDPGAVFMAGRTYRLSVDLAYAHQPPPAADRIQVQLYYVDGSNVMHTVAQATPGGQTDPQYFRQDAFTTYTLTTPFLTANDAAVGQQIGIMFDSIDNGGNEFDLDNVQLTSDVPEPAMLGFIGISALAMLRRRRRGAAR